MLSVDDLLRLWLQREKDAGPKKARDRETLEMFEGRMAVPLPEMDGLDKAAVANLLAQGITAKAERIASTRPNAKFLGGPSRAAQKRAREKTRALTGMWDENVLHLQRRQRARWMIGYADAPVIVRPKWDAKRSQWSVKWELRSSLSTYAAPTPEHLDMAPRDVIFASTMNASKIEGMWPLRRGAVRALRGYTVERPRDDRVTLVEYCGPDEYVCVVVGVCDVYNRIPGDGINVAVHGSKYAVLLERTENRVERCMAIIPNALGLEGPITAHEGTKGMYQMRAALTAKEYRYVANSVDPPLWFVEGDGGGDVTPADGPAGVIGRIPNGGQIVPINPPPGMATNNMIDRFERGERVEAGTPPDLGGESGTNIRTGRRGQDLLASVLDFPIQEAQELLAQSQWLEDRLAMDIALAYFPNLKRSWGGFEFTPAVTFTPGDWHEVSYALAGADANGQVIRYGQLQGTGLVSKQTARENIPDIADAEFEADQVMREQIEAGILAEVAQPSVPGQPGGMTIIDKARLMQLVGDNKKDLAEAVLQVQLEAQERQSSAVDPVAAGAPEAQPGVTVPGSGAEAGTVGPAPDLAGLSSLLTQLRAPQQFSTPQEQAAEVGASVR